MACTAAATPMRAATFDFMSLLLPSSSPSSFWRRSRVFTLSLSSSSASVAICARSDSTRRFIVSTSAGIPSTSTRLRALVSSSRSTAVSGSARSETYRFARLTAADDRALADARGGASRTWSRCRAAPRRLLDGRRLERDRREAPHDPAVALVDLAHALGRRRREDPDLAAREERLQQIADARPLHALTEERVEVLHDEDDLAVPLAELVDEALEAALDLSAQLRPGDDGARVELEEAGLREVRRDVAARDALGDPADEGGLADAWLADHERVVLEAALEDLDQPARLGVAADHRIEAPSFASATRSRT
jgi:hypothetical protein